MLQVRDKKGLGLSKSAAQLNFLKSTSYYLECRKSSTNLSLTSLSQEFPWACGSSQPV
jgi:hypothetical protein